MDDAYLELIHKQIDGDLTPDEQDRLDTHLAEHPDAQALFNDLTAVAGLLDKVEAREPPPHLKAAILRALPAERYARATGKTRRSLWSTLIEALQAKPRYALAYAFSFGLLVGLAAFAFFAGVVQSTPDASSVVGTIVSEDAAREVVDEAAIDREGVRGTVQVEATGTRVVVALTLDASEAADVQLAFDENAFSLQSYSRQHDRPGHALVAEADRIRLSILGENTYLIAFNDKAAQVASIELQLRRGQRVVYEKSLATRAR